MKIENNILEFDKLCSDAKNGNTDALKLIMEKLKPFIIKKSLNIHLKNYDIEDFISISNISLYKAIKCFDFKRKRNFFPYAIMTIKNNLNMEIRKASKNWMESSLDEHMEKGENVLLSSTERLMEDVLLNKQEILELMKVLTLEEKNIIVEVYYKNMSLADYARISKSDYKKCKNLKLKAIRKMRKLIP